MSKKSNNAVEAQGAVTSEMKQFKLDEIGFRDLNGKMVKLVFDNKEFGNLLFANAPSIEMDSVAKEIHSSGTSQMTDDVLRQLDNIVQYCSHFNYRVKTAISEYVNKLIGG